VRASILTLALAAALALLLPRVADLYMYSVVTTVLIWIMLGQAWNLLGGYAGQVSFGHAMYLGVGAYAAMLAVNQEAIMRVQVGIPGAWETCTSVFPCGSVFASTPEQYTGRPDFARAKKLLAEAKYDDAPIVILDTPELHNLSKTATVAAALLQQAGFKTRLQPLDWASWLQKRTSMAPANAGGWNLFFAAWDPQDLMLPLASAPLTANGKNGWPGWFEDAEVERLMVEFTGAASLAAQQRIAAEIQRSILDQAAVVPLGQTAGFGVMRKGSLEGLLPRIASTVFWNVKLTGL